MIETLIRSTQGPFVGFCSRANFEKIQPDRDWAAISIRDPIEEPPAGIERWTRALPLTFVDAGYTESTIRDFGPAFSRCYGDYFTGDQARAIHQFVAGAIAAGARGFVVHCHQGKSRSAAVASWIAETHRWLMIGHPDVSRSNQHVLAMLRNPARYDAALASVGRLS